MRFKRVPQKSVSLESIAFTDIVMNLFLFFFITFNLFSTFKAMRESPLKVKLPTLSKGPVVKTAFVHEIVLTKAGDILWDEKKITSEQLTANLRDEENKSKPISLRADREASVQALVSVLETIRDSGSVNVSLQTKLEPGTKK